MLRGDYYLYSVIMSGQSRLSEHICISNECTLKPVLSLMYRNQDLVILLYTWLGGSNPIFAHGKMCVFPFFPKGGKMGKKVYGKRGK